MGHQTVIKDGSVTATLGPEWTEFARKAVEAALPGVLRHMERTVAEVAQEAHDEWPVGQRFKPVHSRDGLQVTTQIDIARSRVRVAITNDVPYWVYVRPKKWYGAATAIQRLVRDPMGRLQKELVQTLGPEIVAAIRKAV